MTACVAAEGAEYAETVRRALVQSFISLNEAFEKDGCGASGEVGVHKLQDHFESSMTYRVLTASCCRVGTFSSNDVLFKLRCVAMLALSL